MKTRSYRGANTGVWATHGFGAPPDTLSKGVTWAIEFPVNRAFSHDLVAAQSTGESASGYVCVSGDKGAGKTLAAKIQAVVSSSTQAFSKEGVLIDQSVHVYNRKMHEGVMEWLPTIKDLGGTEEDLSRLSFDSFDPEVSYNENFSRALEIFEYLLDRPNNVTEAKSLRAAIRRLREHRVRFLSLTLIGALRTISIEDVKAIRSGEDDEMIAEIIAHAPSPQVADGHKNLLAGSRVTESSLLDIQLAGEQLADVLSNMRDPDGPYGKLLSGSVPFSSLQRRPSMILNYHNMKGKQTGMIELIRMQGEIYDPSLRPKISIEEEFHLALKGNIPLLKLMADETSVARSFDQRKYFLTQYPDNFLSGDVGSAERGYSLQFWRGFDVQQIFQLPNDPKILEILAQLRLSRDDIKFITGQQGELKPGTCLYVPKGKPARRIFVRASDDFIKKYGESRQATALQVDERRHVDDFDDTVLPWS